MAKKSIYKDITGQVFGRLTAIKPNGKNNQREIIWLCKCSCGNYTNVSGSNLRLNRIKSCGCLQKEIASKRISNDLIGKRCGRLTVIRQNGRNNQRNIMWLCKCDCGNEITVVGTSLSHNRTKSCGCLNKERVHETWFKDLIGQRFGKLLVIQRCEKNKNRNYKWLCKCDCGNIIVVDGSSLMNKNTRSCGCLQKEITSSRCGELSPTWKGGISFFPYCEKFNKKKKEEIREQYNRVCLICGKTEAENKRKLDIHHVDYRKDQGCGDNKWQLVPLCKSCHSKTNHNRTFWEYNIKWILAQRKSKEN